MGWTLARWVPNREAVEREDYKKALQDNARWLKTKRGLAARRRYNRRRNALLRKFNVGKLADIYSKLGIPDPRPKAAHRIDIDALVKLSTERGIKLFNRRVPRKQE